MKKNLSLLILLTLLTGCITPESRSWIIPVSTEPSDLIDTPAAMKGFAVRRDHLLDSLKEGFVILESTDQCSYNRHEFRPNNYFYYLTGYTFPNSFAILSNMVDYSFILFLPPYSIRAMIYMGAPLPADQVKALYNPDLVLTYPDLRDMLDSIVKTGEPVYLDRSDLSNVNELKRIAGNNRSIEIRDVADLVDEMRVIKSSLEVERIQKACNITARAILNAMKECRAGLYEFEIESIIEGTFLQYGSAMPGFSSIVGSGPNSTILHYESNSRKMENGDLLLMDIGAEYGYYTADITRTIPVNGRFSREQRTIYQLVLDAQLAAIDKMIPGNMFMDGHMAAREVIVEGLYSLGLITDPSSPWQIQFYILYPSSHYLGLDVHDVGDMGGSFQSFMQQTPGDSIPSRVLEPGMVITIEPGLYFREKGMEQIFEIFGDQVDSLEIAEFVEKVSPVYEKFLNIGVRIEDDILLTREGNINLSRYAPKEISDIEQLMK